MNLKKVVQISFIAIAIVAYFIVPIITSVYCGQVVMHTEHAATFVRVYDIGMNLLTKIA